MKASLYLSRHGDNAGSAWLRNRGGDIKGSGVGYTNDITTDRTKVRSNAKDANTRYLMARHGKGAR